MTARQTVQEALDRISQDEEADSDSEEEEEDYSPSDEEDSEGEETVTSVGPHFHIKMQAG